MPEIVVQRGDRHWLVSQPVSHLFPAEQYGVLLPEGRPASLASDALVAMLREEARSKASRT